MAKLMKAAKVNFEKNKKIYESALLTFHGVRGFDVYNCSIPFFMHGKKYLFGRVERNDEWANSWVRLFVETEKDVFTVVPNSMIWQLEDPYIAKIHGEMIFGGTHVQKRCGLIQTYFGYFYRGTPENLTYFTTGPNYMKDIRLVQLADGTIGVFSRPRSDTHSSIGFTIIKNINELSAEVIATAPSLPLLEEGTWGGVNQAYLLSCGKIGCIGHKSYLDTINSLKLEVYVNISFILDPVTRLIEQTKIIGTKSCYPACQPKVPKLIDCVFSSGISPRHDGKVDLYSGVGDVHQGRITIDYPFKGFGEIVGDMTFDVPKIKSSL